MKLTIREILQELEGALLQGDAETAVRRLSIDSRDVAEGTLFVPVIGEKTDGHRFLRNAAEAGASAVLSSSKEAAEALSDLQIAVILVPDTVDALQAIGRMARVRLSIPAVGISGSVGKTTTREMVNLALSAGFRTYKTGKNYNNRLGVPLTLSEIPEDAEIAVLELGLNVPGELGTISALADLDTAVLTNIGTAHMEYYGDQEGLTREKFTITRGFTTLGSRNTRERRLFLNADDPYLRRHAEFSPYPATTYGLSEDADFRAENLRSENGHYVFDCYRHGVFVRTVRLSALGSHNVLNALAALAVADHYGVDSDRAADAIESFTGFPGRLYRTEKDGVLYIDDTYNASPASMKAGLSVLQELSFGANEKIAVLGDMLELGPDSAALHYGVGKAAASYGLKEVVLVGTEAREIGRGLRENGSKARLTYFNNAEEALDYLKDRTLPGRTFYFKASHGMHFAAITEALTKDV